MFYCIITFATTQCILNFILILKYNDIKNTCIRSRISAFLVEVMKKTQFDMIISLKLLVNNISHIQQCLQNVGELFICMFPQY